MERKTFKGNLSTAIYSFSKMNGFTTKSQIDLETELDFKQ